MDFALTSHFAEEIFAALRVDQRYLYQFIPLLLLLELPLMIVVITGMLKWRQRYDQRQPVTIQPSVSCIVTCYAEGHAITKTISTLCEQTYPGHIEIIAVIDGAVQNRATYDAALDCREWVGKYVNRSLVVLPKWQRGGRVSSGNAALAYAKGEIVVYGDGDTSFDNDMLYELIREFADPNVPAVAGALRVRNSTDSLVTRMQAIEYIISLQGGKTGLAEWNLINNISGAFGAVRRDFLRQMGGWDTHSAEDLDLTVRIKQYFTRFPGMRIPFAARAIGHTDAPVSLKQLFFQRLRWDGDLVFIYLRKHRYGFSSRLLGFKTYLFTMVYGIVQNVVLSILIVLFNLWLVIVYPWQLVAALFLLQYLYYLLQALLFLGVFIAGVSERPTADGAIMVWIPVYPLYTLMMRFITAFAIFNEVLRRGHEESNMAPWWVLKRGRRF